MAPMPLAESGIVEQFCHQSPSLMTDTQSAHHSGGFAITPGSSSGWNNSQSSWLMVVGFDLDTIWPGYLNRSDHQRSQSTPTTLKMQRGYL